MLHLEKKNNVYKDETLIGFSLLFWINNFYVNIYIYIYIKVIIMMWFNLKF